MTHVCSHFSSLCHVESCQTMLKLELHPHACVPSHTSYYSCRKNSKHPEKLALQKEKGEHRPPKMPDSPPANVGRLQMLCTVQSLCYNHDGNMLLHINAADL